MPQLERACHSEERGDEESAVPRAQNRSRFLAPLGMTTPLIQLVAIGLLLLVGAGCNTNPSASEKTSGQEARSSSATSPGSMSMGADIKEKNFDRLPAFAFKDLSGQMVSSEQFKGKVLLVNVWATWCPPCKEEMPWFEELQKKYGSKGLAVIGVSIDPNPADAADFAKELGATYTLLHHPEIMQEWGLLGLPTTFIVDREGRIRTKIIGFEYKEKFEKLVNELLQDARTADTL